MYFENIESGSSSKLGIISENKVVQKLKLEKNGLYKKWSPQLIFLYEIIFEKIPSIFDTESTISALFDEP